MNAELDFICDVCGRPVEDREGALYVLLSDVRGYQSGRAEWEKTRPEHGALDVGTLLMMPSTIPWRIQHNACGAPVEDVYDICVEHVRTWRALLKWTAHLMAKTWLPSTNWASVMESAAEGRDRRIVEHVHNDAA